MDEDEQRELEWLRWELQEVGEDGGPPAEEQQQHEPSYHNSTPNNTGYPQHFLHPPLPPSAHQQPAFPPFLSPHTAPRSPPGGENGTFPVYCARDAPGVPIAAPVAAHGFVPPLSNPFDRRGTEERAEQRSVRSPLPSSDVRQAALPRFHP
ncbi:unnamed protein product [Vitrella brassicaformis CCMP3155]|uniref:Uncharacterized protein n=1 Tax=Vitrella brassicaformis (strain CCMP3155) TaxID=1169540 RepID=A0A0G4EEH0_VITBC|nr:unnamed protein product [Vitrella brassicaformis CCMP3155]|eukprot:CEL94081.1 unnamed protein product [Vitrella brassicaformis CCMP3155]